MNAHIHSAPSPSCPFIPRRASSTEGNKNKTLSLHILFSGSAFRDALLNSHLHTLSRKAYFTQCLPQNGFVCDSSAHPAAYCSGAILHDASCRNPLMSPALQLNEPHAGIWLALRAKAPATQLGFVFVFLKCRQSAVASFRAAQLPISYEGSYESQNIYTPKFLWVSRVLLD